MSTFEDSPVTCPHCGTVAERFLARGVQGLRAEEQRKRVLDGTFQVYTCDNCKQDYRVDQAFSYVDPSRKQWFVCFGEYQEPHWQELEDEPVRLFRDNVTTNAAPMAHALLEDVTVRAVFGVDALREKLVAMELGLDDSTLEVLKLELLRSRGDVRFSPATRPRLVAGDSHSLVFEAPAGKHRQPLRIPREAYRRVSASSGYEALRARLTAGPYVDLGRIMLAGGQDASAME